MRDPGGAYRSLVSIPNGKPGPLRPPAHLATGTETSIVSIPNGKPGPLRHAGLRVVPGIEERFNPKREARPSQTPKHRRPCCSMERFQSQTGSQALSDNAGAVVLLTSSSRFNPKREARPSQTRNTTRGGPFCRNQFQSQTGSQALSDSILSGRDQLSVVFQSQTGSQALSDSTDQRRG